MASRGLKSNVQELLALEAEDPFRKPPPFEKRVGDLAEAYSLYINIQHRLVYQVFEEERVVKVLRLWNH
ncbi:Txe/YoeB family addiction module toxin [Halomonas sp. LC1]|uniref:Txe/YoeB family addiction module toxin n=1 Tax=Halomonas sp. LC1 TaxID=3043733 RepID=UPI002555BAD5|nr:Txe/YoeB family addiction module toxin [Halomonas sp. LC1]MDK9688864.1 Txe/YoeB family addiction module toxin [Halomonas sp. LC1]